MVIKTLSSHSEDIALAYGMLGQMEKKGVVIDMPIYIK